MARRWAALAVAGGVGVVAGLWARATGGAALPVQRFTEFAFLLLVAAAGAAAFAGAERDAAPGAESRGRWWVAPAICAVLTVGLFGRSLGFDFLADDFFNCTLGVISGWELYRPQPDWHHFFPLGIDLNAAAYYLAGWRPVWFHVHQLLVWWVTGVAVMHLGRQWGLDRAAALAAGLLWISFPLSLEGAVWICITAYTYSALFVVLGLLAFGRYLRTGAWWGAAVCVLCAVASVLCLEQGAALVPVCWTAAWLRREHLRGRARLGVVAALAAPAVAVGGLFLWKRAVAGQFAYAGVSPLHTLRTACAYGWSLLTPGSSAGLHIGLALAQRGTAVLAGGLLGALGLAAAAAWRGSPARQLGVALAWIGGLPIILGSTSIASRHYMLPAVGVALVCAAWFGEAAPERRRGRAWVVACVVAASAWWSVGWQSDFARASAAVRAVRQGIAAQVSPTTPYARIALVDLPWGVGEREWPVLTFATGSRVLTGWLRDDYDLEAIRAIRVWRTGPPGRTVSEAEFVDRATLRAAVADPEQVVLRWDGAAGVLRRLGPGRLDEGLEGD